VTLWKAFGLPRTDRTTAGLSLAGGASFYEQSSMAATGVPVKKATWLLPYCVELLTAVGSSPLQGESWRCTRSDARLDAAGATRSAVGHRDVSWMMPGAQVTPQVAFSAALPRAGRRPGSVTPWIAMGSHSQVTREGGGVNDQSARTTHVVAITAMFLWLTPTACVLDRNLRRSRCWLGKLVRRRLSGTCLLPD